MAGRSYSGTGSEKRVRRAVDFVSDYWFPVNPTLLETIQTRLNQENYSPDQPRALVDDICKDFSLFTFCLRKLHKMLQREGLSAPEAMNPIQVLEWAGMDRLEQILGEQSAQLTAHSMKGGDTLQLGRFQEMLVSSSTAQSLCSSYGIDEETAYSASVLRQLGLTLIAWNYSGLYEEVVQSLQPGDKLEVLLAKRLGFSPNLLAIRVMNSWGMSYGACAELGLVDELADTEAAISEAMGDTLVELCEVGEALARAQQPDVYPDAKEDWSAARGEIERVLGPDGMDMIHTKIEENAEGYLAFIPDVYDFGLVTEVDSFASDAELIERNFGNPFLEQCSPQVSRSMNTLYQQIYDGTTRRENIKGFINDVVSAAQFSGGCIYTADPALMLLVPQNEFGRVQLRETSPVDYSIVLSQADMIAVAYQSTEPILEYRLSPEGEVVTAIAGMFGKSQKVGILYLEIPDAVSDFMRDDKVIHFKALRHMLNEVLRLT